MKKILKPLQFLGLVRDLGLHELAEFRAARAIMGMFQRILLPDVTGLADAVLLPLDILARPYEREAIAHRIVTLYIGGTVLALAFA
jgi:hypothetical protein